MKTAHFVLGEFLCCVQAVLNFHHVSIDPYGEVIRPTLSFLGRQLSWESEIYVFSLYLNQHLVTTNTGMVDKCEEYNYLLVYTVCNFL